MKIFMYELRIVLIQLSSKQYQDLLVEGTSQKVEKELPAEPSESTLSVLQDSTGDYQRNTRHLQVIGIIVFHVG